MATRITHADCKGSRRAFLALPIALTLAGCGFKLRQPPHFNFKTIRLAMPANSALMLQLTRELNATHQVQVIADPAKAEVTLVSTGEKREQSILSLSPAGEVLEYELRLRFAFRVTGPGGRELVPQTEILRRMNQSYSETAALSKGYEAQMLYQSMQDNIAQQVMRRLSMIRLEQANAAPAPIASAPARPS
ncbi:MAG: LPS assembly lipoprotein LptE [Burkholderiaceae bacterium]|jgi:LPS-assembly lipoprotein|nr:LPS assembly lipoprotein LptE [Burkholderiaceae bacterium]